MNLPTSRGHDALHAAISSRMTTYTLTRPTQTTGAMGGTDGTTDVSVELWVFDPNEVNTDTDFGERLNGSLGGLTQPSTDVQVGDRLTYQSIEYEVAETMTYDSAVGDTYKLVNFVRYS